MINLEHLFPEVQTLLSEQRGSIGASRAAAILGLDPFKTRFEVWQDMIEPDLHRGMDFAQARGLALEPLLLAWYEQWSRRKVHRPTVLRHPDASLPRHAHLDAEVIPDKQPRTFLECKTRGAGSHGWGDDGTGEVPDDIYWQCQHTFGVAHAAGHMYEQCDVIVSIGGNAPKVYQLFPNQEHIAELWEHYRDFMRFVWERERPPLMGAREIPLRHPESGDTVDYLTAELADQIGWAKEADDAYREARAQADAAKRERDRRLAPIQEAMGDRWALLDEKGRPVVTWKTQLRRGYKTEDTSFRTFRFTGVDA